MEDFATYILNEKNYIQKMLVANYMSKKTGIYFQKSIVLRAQIAKMFLDYTSLDVDKNTILTAVLLCNCKKVDNVQKIGKLETYAKEGADFLATLGFDSRFCKICEGVNRYTIKENREKESDILELVDQFSGLIIKREERDAFTPKEALIILKERNLKEVNNRYLEDFIVFVNAMENINIKDNVEVPVIRKLASLCEKEKNAKTYIATIGNRYADQIESLIKLKIKEQAEEELYSKNQEKEASKVEKTIESTKKTLQTAHRYTRAIEKKNAERALFSPEATRRILNHESDFKIN